MPSTEATAKICVKCNQDCSGKPRSKDAQGRYICKACLDGLKARKEGAAPPAKPAPARGRAAVAPPPVDEGSVLSNLLADAPDPCPSCASPMPPGAVLCNFCGFNKASGQAVRTQVSRASKEKKTRAGPAFEFTPMWTGVIAIGLQAALLAASLAVPGMVLAFLLVYFIVSISAFITLIVCCVKDQNIGWLIASLLIPFVVFFYVFGVSERGHLKAITLAQIFGVLMLLGFMAANPDFAEELSSARSGPAGPGTLAALSPLARP
ncbi:MAG: hypothetical protein WD749_04270 [Phycisphaerales bacterium]